MPGLQGGANQQAVKPTMLAQLNPAHSSKSKSSPAQFIPAQPIQPNSSHPIPSHPIPSHPIPSQTSPAQPSSAHLSPPQPTSAHLSPAQPSPSQPSPAHVSPAQPSPAQQPVRRHSGWSQTPVGSARIDSPRRDLGHMQIAPLRTFHISAGFKVRRAPGECRPRHPITAPAGRGSRQSGRAKFACAAGQPRANERWEVICNCTWGKRARQNV